ncbi:MAG: polysaccharide deacetylase family protein [Xanthobacteraceae bacterium]|nr:polysaccharide deacetylase family protein [Xanthobacteraceae bacterium]
MRIRLCRFARTGLAAFALSSLVVPAFAANCPGNPNAIGTSRTIVVDPTEHRKIGTMNYAETLPLVDKEVVLTFDDGPLPPYTDKILDILAAECVKATYFIVGVMARANPELVRRVHEDGHTVGTHSLSHPLHFRMLGLAEAKAQVDGGIAATAAALGDAQKVAPFFRFPGFGHSAPVEAYAASRGLMVWGADAPADDWLRLSAREVAKRAVRRLEGKGKGILLLHDIHQRTVDALPILLKELKANGFRIVHVQHTTPTRPATVTAAADWKLNSRSTRSLQSAPVQAAALASLSLDGLRLQDRSADELCQLEEPPRAKPIMAAAAADRRAKPIRIASPDIHAIR